MRSPLKCLGRIRMKGRDDTYFKYDLNNTTIQDQFYLKLINTKQNCKDKMLMKTNFWIFFES